MLTLGNEKTWSRSCHHVTDEMPLLQASLALYVFKQAVLSWKRRWKEKIFLFQIPNEPQTEVAEIKVARNTQQYFLKPQKNKTD